MLLNEAMSFFDASSSNSFGNGTDARSMTGVKKESEDRVEVDCFTGVREKSRAVNRFSNIRRVCSAGRLAILLGKAVISFRDTSKYARFTRSIRESGRLDKRFLWSCESATNQIPFSTDEGSTDVEMVQTAE